MRQKLVEVDDRIRQSLSIAATTMLSGFIGIAASRLPDTIVIAGIILATIICVAGVHYLVGRRREHDWFDRAMLFIVPTILWICVAVLTEKPWLAAAIVFGWSGFAILFQTPKIMHELEASHDELMEAITQLRDAAEKRQRDND